MLWYVILFNALSFFIIANFNKNMRIRNLHKGHNKITTYLIPGMAPDNHNPFGWLLDGESPLRGEIRELSFQNFGFDPRVVARQLDIDIDFIRKQDYVSNSSVKRLIGRHIDTRERQIVLISMSMGAQIPLFMESEKIEHIAINPCYGSQSLKLKVQTIHWIAIVLELLILPLGWFSYLPIIKIGDSYFSLALYADWIYWSTIEIVGGDVYVDGLITSDFDKLINNNWVHDHVRILNPYCDRRVHCGHCDVKNHREAYVYHIKSILRVIIDPYLRDK